MTAECVRDLAAMTGTPAQSIVAPAPETQSALRDTAVWFTQNYRFAADSGIGQLAVSRQQRRRRITTEWLRQGAHPDVAWLDEAGQSPATSAAPLASLEALARMESGYAAYVGAVAATPDDPAAITAAFNRFRVLCAVREGPRGVNALNAEMTRRFRAALRLPGLDEGPLGSPWFAGRPVLVSSNDYMLKLFNGDIGIALPDSDGRLLVHFADAESPGGFRAIAPLRLPRHETAFAMTVHKSQGSEFDEVLILLPDQGSRVLTRELLYTAVTRARKRVALAARAAVLESAISTPTERHSGLLTRVADAAREGHAPQDAPDHGE